MLMKQRLPLLLFTTLACTPLLSAKTVSGKIFAEADTIPVSAASCTLVAENLTLSTARSADNGSFTISTDRKGNMTLTVEKEGFDPTEIIIDSGKETIDLGIVWLTSSTTLEEFTVEGRTEFDAKGRTIIYPGSADVKASDDALSLFQKLPLAGLISDPINRAISVLGSAPVIIIDGVPSSVSDLLVLQPKQIEKVEYSIIPPARYAAQGRTGYLNITLKQRNDGGTVYLWGRSAFNTVFVDGSFDVSYHQGPSKFQISTGPSWRNYHKVDDFRQEAYIGSDGFRLDLESKSRTPFNYFSFPNLLRYVYAPKPSTVFSATLNVSSFSDHRTSAGHTLDFLHDDYDFDNQQRSRDFGTALDLYFRHDFNDSHSLEAEMTGTLKNSSYERTNIYRYLSGRTEEYPVDINGDRSSLITDISYTYNMSSRSELTAGLTNTLSHNKNEYQLTDYTPTLTENNNNIYVQYATSFSRFYASLRTGARLNWLRNDDDRRHYIRNLSSLQLQWTPTSLFSLSASANYSNGVPGLSSLTDYEQQTTPYLISNGNPDLKSSHSVSANLRPSLRYRKLTLLGMVAYRTTIDGTYADISYLGNGMFLSQSSNFKRNETWTAMLQVQMSNLKGFGFNATVEYDHYAADFGDWRKTLGSWSGYINLWYNYRKFTFSYYRLFSGKSLYAQTVSKGENNDALQVTYRPDKHWTMTLSWMYMFEKKGTQYPAWGYSPVNPYYLTRHIRDNANMVCLSVSYTLDFGSIFRSARRNLNNSDRDSSILKL